jgi:hypothetical protein
MGIRPSSTIKLTFKSLTPLIVMVEKGMGRLFGVGGMD